LWRWRLSLHPNASAETAPRGSGREAARGRRGRSRNPKAGESGSGGDDLAASERGELKKASEGRPGLSKVRRAPALARRSQIAIFPVSSLWMSHNGRIVRSVFESGFPPGPALFCYRNGPMRPARMKRHSSERFHGES
jgi:hypothetical protein